MPERWELKQKQSLPLELKVKMTQRRLEEWYNHFDGEVYISFSGGKDSTVLLDIARKMFPDIEAMFVDTGLEYPEVRDFVKTFDNVTIVKPKLNFKEVIQTYGYPIISKEVASNVYYAKRGSQNGMDRMNGLKPDGTPCPIKQRNIKYKYLLDAPFPISNRCCAIMKKNPAKQYEHDVKKKPIVGMLANESFQREQAWIKNGCNAFWSERPMSQPMAFWTEQDVLRYLLDNKTPYCDVYGDIVECEGKLSMSKLDRTGCVFCGFGAHLDKNPNRFQKLKETHPKLWEYCMKPLSDGGLGMAEVLDYIKVEYR